MISCRELYALPSLQKLRLVAGEAGLDRRIRWVHFIDLPDVVPWVQGGELLIITGIALNGDTQKLKEMVHGIIRKKLAGIIVNVGPYIRQVPPEVLELADQEQFPVFELPWEVKIVKVTSEICHHIMMRQTEERSVADFLEQLLFQPTVEPAVILQRAAYYGYDLTQPHQIAILRPTDLLAYSAKQTPRNKQKLVALKLQFEHRVQDALVGYDGKILSILKMDDMILLLPHTAATGGTSGNMQLLAELLDTLEGKFPGLAINAGLGCKFEEWHLAKQSYWQADKVLRFFADRQPCHSIYAFEHLGIYKLLLEMPPDKLSAFYQEVIQPLNEYDEKHSMDLEATLFAYFEENCNAAQTAKRLFVHRNTLDYRLKKIEEISGKKLADPYERLTLQLGVIIGKQLFIR